MKTPIEPYDERPHRRSGAGTRTFVILIIAVAMLIAFLFSVAGNVSVAGNGLNWTAAEDGGL